MPQFPQYPNALLVESANYRTGLDANATAAAGDVCVFTPTAARVLTLPAVAAGGPVCVVLAGTFGAGFGVKIVPSDSSQIEGIATGPVGSVLLNNAGDQVVLASDGTNWWAISKSHNTHDSF